MKFPHLLSWKALSLIFLFCLAYSLLAIIKHNHFLSGYDLAVSDQVMWKYAYLHNPITTIHAYPFTYMMADHVEFIFIFLAPIFWVWNTVLALITAQAVFFCLSGIPVYLLARKKGLNEMLSLTILFSYLFFFGAQNALWNDVHSNVFGAGFLSWMIYFLERENWTRMWISFFLAITAKEDIAFLTGAIGITWLIKGLLFERVKRVENFTSWTSRFVLQWRTLSKNKISLLIILFSLVYLFLVFVVYFPHFTPQGYRFSGNENLLVNVWKFTYLLDTAQKRQIIFYSLGWFGFVPLFVPVYLIPWFADLYHFFVLGHAVAAASEIFLHYRVSLAPLLAWPTIIAISWLMKLLQSANRLPTTAVDRSRKAVSANILQLFLTLYLLVCTFAIQYALHLPLSYLTKSWLWQTGPEVTTINHTLTFLPPNASVVSQNNITPHIGHRDNIFTLWPSSRSYKTLASSPCGQFTCPWFHWVGNPKYMIVDTSSDFDIRHFLQNRPDFLSALATFEKLKKIQMIHREGTTTLYKILQNP